EERPGGPAGAAEEQRVDPLVAGGDLPKPEEGEQEERPANIDQPPGWPVRSRLARACPSCADTRGRGGVDCLSLRGGPCLDCDTHRRSSLYCWSLRHRLVPQLWAMAPSRHSKSSWVIDLNASSNTCSPR